MPQTGWSIQQKFISSHSWRLNIQAKSKCKQDWFLLRPLFLVCRWQSSSCVFTCSSLCAYVLISSSYLDTSHIGLGPTHTTSFYLNYLLKGPIFNWFILSRFYLFIFREGKGGRKRGIETSMCGCLLCTPTEDLAHKRGLCPDWKSNQRPFGL